jgi:hypothetical protein
MAFLPPVTTTVSIAPISITFPVTINGTGITYNQFLQSLGSFNYGVNFFYISAGNYQQITQPVFYNHFNAAGNQVSTYLPWTAEPYQQQPSLYFEVNSEQIIFDGFSSLSLNIYPQSTVYFKFYADVLSISSGLNKGGNNFQDIEEAEGINFFEDYCNYIIDCD